jgi:hypothetical protein
MMPRHAPRCGLDLRSGAVAVCAIVLLVVTAGTARAQSTMTPAMEAVVRYNAPIFLQETSTDYLNRTHQLINHPLQFAFDCDTWGFNNAQSLNDGNICDAVPTVYYSIVETGATADEGTYFIGYYVYHGRDGGWSIGGPISSFGHDHDLEGVYLIVRKRAYTPYGELVFAWSQAHGAMIPYADADRADMNFNRNPNFDTSWGGRIRYYYDWVFGVNRPVAAMALDTHGTYLAQSCSPQDNGQPNAYYEIAGYDRLASGSGSFVACVRSFAGSALVFRPAADDNNVATLPFYQNSGQWEYGLLNFATSPIWQGRTVGGDFGYLQGALLDLGYGQQGLKDFHPTGANPPWAWQGGAGFGPNGFYWYHLWEDGTGNSEPHHRWGDWAPGMLLTNPGVAAASHFCDYPIGGCKFTSGYEPVLFNEYRQPDPLPSCNGMQVSVEGPDVLNTGWSGTWTANVSCGTGTYTYQWTGLVYGTTATVSGEVYGEGDIYLDVWDSSGAHIAVSKHVMVTGCSGANLC